MYERYQHERNYKCRIREFIYKGLRTVTLENELIRVSVLADKGTDIYEFIYKPKDVDFMWHSFNGVRNPSQMKPSIEMPDGSFLDFYEGGWQELFPNIGDACKYNGALLGVHGEVCMPPWEYRIELDTPQVISVKFWIRTARSPYYLEKIFTVKEGDGTLYIDEKVTNEGTSDLEFMWGHHPAFGPIFLDDTCVIEFPQGVKAKTAEGDHGPYAPLPEDTEFIWPFITDNTGKVWDMSKVPPSDSKLFFEYQINSLPEGWYAVKNKGLGVGFQMNWDKDRFPFVWVWAPYGGAVNYPWYGRNYNLAIEPWTAVPGNLTEVVKAGLGVRIQPGQEICNSFQAKAFEFGGGSHEK